VLLPGLGKTHSFERKPIDFNWQLRVPVGRYLAANRSENAVLTVYVNVERPRAPLDRKKAAKWVAELNDDSFEAREAATRELEKLGAAVRPLLSEALKGRPAPEARRRIVALLEKLKGTHAGDLDVPPGVTVVTPTDLLAKHFEGLKAADQNKCI